MVQAVQAVAEVQYYRHELVDVQLPAVVLVVAREDLTQLLFGGWQGVVRGGRSTIVFFKIKVALI